MAYQLTEMVAILRDNIQWALPLGLITVAFSYILYQRYFHPLAFIPGPFWASLSRLWMTKHSWDGKQHLARQ